MEIKPQEIKDYIHMYIGQQFVMKIDNTMSPDHGKYTSPMIFDANALCAYNSKKDRINPILILRKLSDMTEEDRLKYGWTIEETDEGLKVNYPFESFRLLCKDGWDLFGLIPAGLAIDKTSLKNETQS